MLLSVQIQRFPIRSVKERLAWLAQIIMTHIQIPLESIKDGNVLWLEYFESTFLDVLQKIALGIDRFNACLLEDNTTSILFIKGLVYSLTCLIVRYSCAGTGLIADEVARRTPRQSVFASIS